MTTALKTMVRTIGRWWQEAARARAVRWSEVTAGNDGWRKPKNGGRRRQ